MRGIFFPEAKEDFGFLPSIPFILKEIYIDKWYEPYMVGHTDMVIWDIGAYVGITADYFSQYAKIIHAVEPNKENYECLLKSIKTNKLTKVKPYKAAIANKDGKLKLYYGGQNTAHNILGGVSGFEEVDAWSLETLLDKTGEKHIDLMKMDVEGAEFEILGGNAFRKVAPRIEMITGEIHSWAQINPSQIMWALKDNGFKVDFPKSGDAMVYVARRI